MPVFVPNKEVANFAAIQNAQESSQEMSISTDEKLCVTY